jgi:hypothetical protein
LGVDAFKEELYRTLNELKGDQEGVILIVTPPHSAGRMLGEIAGDFLGAKHICHDHLKGLPAVDRELMLSANHIIILDDVMITGNRIQRYLRALREEFDNDHLKKSLRKVTWFPMIARPPESDTIATIRDSLGHHAWENELIFLYDVVLPHWDRKSCPWCQEAEILEKTIGTPFDEPEWYRSRRESLIYGTGQGISERPLLLLPGVETRTAGGSSPLADEGACEMQVLFLFAVALQRLRTDKKEPLGSGLFQNNVLAIYGAQEADANSFCRFSEALFQAVLLRIVKCDEWSKDAKSAGVDGIGELVRAGESDFLLAESILFFHRIGYDRGLPAGFEAALTRWGGDEVVTMLVAEFRR